MKNTENIMTKDKFEQTYTTKRGFFYNLFTLRKLGKEETDRQRIVQQAYQTLLESGKDLFEDSVQQISQEEIETLKQRKKKANRTWLIVVLCIAVPLTVLAILSPPGEENMEEMIGLPFLVIGIFGYRYLMNRNYNAVLSCKEKQVLKGVVTNKYKAEKKKNDDEAGCFLELSLHCVVQVWHAEFKSVRVGDIVQIDVFSHDIGIKPIVTKRGVFTKT